MSTVDVWFGYHSTGSRMCTELHHGAELLAADGDLGGRWAAYVNLMTLLMFVPQAIFNSFFILVNFAVALGFNRQSPAIMAAQCIRAFVTFVVSGLASAVVSRTNRPDDTGGRDLFYVFLSLGLLYSIVGCLQALEVVPSKTTDQESWPSSIVRLDTVLIALTVALLPVDQSASIQPLFWAVVLLLVSAVPSWSNPSVNIIVQGLQLFAYVLLILLGQKQIPQASFFVSAPIVLTFVRFIWVMVCVQLVYSVIVLAIDWSTQNVGWDGKPRNTRSAQEFVVSWPMAVALWLTFVLILIVYLVSSPPSAAESTSSAQVATDRAQWSKPFHGSNRNLTSGGSMGILNKFGEKLKLTVQEDAYNIFPPESWVSSESWHVPKAANNDDYFVFHPTYDVISITLEPQADFYDPQNPTTSFQIQIRDFHPIGNWETTGNENWVTYPSQCPFENRKIKCPGLCIWRRNQCLDMNNQVVPL